jgi:hypothetical protein
MPKLSFCLLLFVPLLTSPAQQNPTLDSLLIHSQIQRIEDALPKIPDRGAARFLEAKLYARLGELPKALELIKECVELNEGFDPSDSPSFQPLRSNAEFQKLTEQIHRQHPPVHKAHVAYTVQEKDLFPEGLAYDPGRKVFHMGSMHRREIVQITQAGEVSDFVKPVYNLLEVGGVRVDLSDHSVWIASDHDGASELVHFDSQGKLLERYPATDPGPHVYNDLVVHGTNEIYTTDTSAHKVYRFNRKSHAFTEMVFPRPLFYPNGITLSGDGNLLYVADDMGVIRVDLRSNAIQDVNPGKNNTLAGIDGLYWYRNSLIGVQYGAGAFRVMRWRLSPDGLRVTFSEVLEYRSPLVSFPTTGAIAEGKFYYIANTGIGNLGHDKIIDPAKLEPVHIAVVPLN